MSRRGVLVIAAVVCAFAFAGCSRTREPDWDTRWRSLASHGPHWRPGAEMVVLTREGGPDGVQELRDRWTLLSIDDSDGTEGTFERRRGTGKPSTQRVSFHPNVPVVPMGGGGHGVYPCVGPLVTVTVPAGRFRCGHTWRDHELGDGRVMRVDEWWAPGVPVPVQSWERWEGVVDTLFAPPRNAGEVRAGTIWGVLESLRQP